MTSPSQPSEDSPQPNPRPNLTTPRKLRACHNCARLKMKCRWPETTENPEACIRCARMRISCVVPTPMQRKKRGKSTRVAQLEQKIDDIVSLLTASQQLQSTSSTTPPTSTPTAPPPPLSSASSPHPPSPKPLPAPTLPPLSIPQDRSPPRTSLSTLLLTHPQPPQPPQPRLPSDSPPEIVPGFDLTFARADTLLAHYRTHYTPFFPFYQLPDNISAATLHAQTPLLFWTLMHIIAPCPPALQLAIKEYFHRTIADRLVVRGERSLELLQSLLLYCGWSDLYIFIEHQATALIHLAISLISNLNLNRPPGSVTGAPTTLFGDAWLTSYRTAMPNIPMHYHSPAEIRATLGIFYLSSIYSTIMKRNQGFHFTSYLGKCIEYLGQNPETEVDEVLVGMVRMQRMAEKIYGVLPNAEMDEIRGWGFNAPIDIAVSSVRRELDFVFNSLKEHVRNSHILLPQYHIITARLYEPLIHLPTHSPTPTTSPLPFLRTESLWTILQTLKSFLTSWFLIPPILLAVSPIAPTSYLAYSLILATKLLVGFNFPDWDTRIARRELDLPDILSRIINRFEEADTTVQQLGLRRRFLADGSPAVAKHVFRLRWLARWYDARIKPGGPVLDMEEMRETLHMEFGLDQEFWKLVLMSDGLQGPADPRMQVDRQG